MSGLTGIVDEHGTPVVSSGFMSGYDGANHSPDRSTVVSFHGLDRREELDQFSRDELERRIRWLVANVGFVKGFSKKAASLVGYAVPDPLTNDEAWNEKQVRRFEDRMFRRGVFDVAGKFCFRTAQPMLSRTRMEAGDGLTVAVLTRSKRRAFKFYEASQLGSPKNSGKEWKDGVKTNQNGRHVAYGIKTEKGVREIPAEACFYWGEYDFSNQHRPPPGLAHAVNHSLDITDIWKDTKKLIKMATNQGLLHTKGSAANPNKVNALPGPPSAPVRVIQSGGSAGGSKEVEYQRAQVFGGPSILSLGLDEDLKELGSEQPHDNVSKFISETLLRDIANGDGLSEAAVWHICSMTGPEVRFLMESLKRWIEERQVLMAEWCRWCYVMWLSNELALGLTDYPEGDEEWWQVGWIWRRDATIDSGRDGNHALKEIDGKLETKRNYTAKTTGRRRDRVVKQILEERLAEERSVAENEEAQMYGLTWEDVYGSERAQLEEQKKGKDTNEQDK